MAGPGQLILLAVSGGIDSMVMLQLFSGVAEHRSLRLAVVHANHTLRGAESDADEEFVRRAAERLGLPFFTSRLATKEAARSTRVSRQLAARRLRYAWFDQVRTSVGADAVATAHNANDNAETVLLNIMRGTGIRGLAGIPPQRNTGRIIRPLLFATRSEIEQYARSAGVKFREDSSNRSLKYARNELRLRILPMLQRTHASDITVSLNRVADLMSDASATLDRLVDDAWHRLCHRRAAGGLDFSLSEWESMDELMRDHLLLRVLDNLGIEPSEARMRSMSRLGLAQTGRQLTLSREWTMIRDRRRFAFRPSDTPGGFSYPVLAGRTNVFPGFTLTISNPQPRPPSLSGRPWTEYVDADRLSGALRVRSWHRGDWFVPLGMCGKKKLSDFFVDQKVPREEKSRVPVLEADGAILWVCGRRLDDRFKLTDRTTHVLKLTYQPLPTGVQS